MCGEQILNLLRHDVVPGSPPRVRGTAVQTSSMGKVHRITPACAGNSVLRIVQATDVEDHPRVCGEQLRVRWCLGRKVGSPPRVRGTVVFHVSQLFHRGITPACAGNSVVSTLKLSSMKDHPRVCGEQLHVQSCLPALLGSPPRVRGTVISVFIFSADKGITPACAGNRPFSGMFTPCIKDHPRVCGEQATWTMAAEAAEGSPPRVRGTARWRGEVELLAGITPACAGNRST